MGDLGLFFRCFFEENSVKAVSKNTNFVAKSNEIHLKYADLLSN